MSNAISKARLVDFNAPSVRLFHQFKLAEHTSKNRRIGWSIFELDKFTHEELHHLSNQDELWVCSYWAKNVIEQNEIKVNTKVVPLGVDTSIFNPTTKQRLKQEPKQDSTYRFYCPGKFELRKSHFETIDCFNKAFNEDSSVELYLTPTNFFISPESTKEWENYIKNTKLGNKIHIIPRVRSHYEIADLLSKLDCVISVSKAEGWNLPVLESLATGLDAIVSNYSAHTEYCAPNSCRLVEFIELEDAYDGIFFHGQGRWAKFGDEQEEQLINHMRAAYKERKFNEEGVKTAEKFTWTNTAQTILKHLEGN